MIESEPGGAAYTIAAVSKQTGITCHALRVWERRYGFPRPERTPSGHRRYSGAQVAVLGEVARRSRRGEPIVELIEQARDGRVRGPAEAVGEEPAGALVARLLDGDLDGADALIAAHDARGVGAVAEQLIAPALADVGDRLFRRDCGMPEERLVSGFLLRKLAAMLDRARSANRRRGPRVLVATPRGDRHEGGAMILSLALELHGWRALNLGADMPVEQIRRAVRALRPDAVGISLVMSRNVRKRFEELAGVRGAPVFLGGRSVLNYQALARRSGFSVISGPAISGLGPFLGRFEDWRGLDPAARVAADRRGSVASASPSAAG